MSSLWRRRRRGRGHKAGKKEADQEVTNSGTKLTVPTHFRCPISLDLMKDPVSLATGITYDREFIEKWLDSGNVTCPVTKQILRNFDQIPNHSLRKMIQCWCVENKSLGVERIPTPRIPVTPYEVSEVCSKIAAAARDGDDKNCLELVMKVKNWAKESERNKRCLVSNGVGAALADIFESFSMEKNRSLLEEIICALTLIFPLSSDCVSKLKSSLSLRRIAYFLKGGDVSARRNAILVSRELMISDDQGCVVDGLMQEQGIKDVSARRNAILVSRELMISDDQGCVVDGLMQEQGIKETLFHMVKVPICPKATQACLMIMHHVILKRPIISSRFVEMGLVSLLLDIIVDGNKNTSEKALGVLDEVCNLEEGKGSARGNALTVPILVKKTLRVSNAATDFCVSILWKICLGENEESAIRALQFGGFQKVLVVLQVGCDEGTKEKATELLRFMNGYRDKVECFDSSMGFKYVKRSI